MTDTTPMQPQGPRPVEDLIAELRADDTPDFRQYQRDLPEPRPVDEIVASTVEASQPFNWDEYGWGSLSDKERRYLEEFAGTQAGARVDATNIPVFGSGVKVAQDLEAARDSLAVVMGEASPDQAFRDAYRFIDAQRKQSSKAKVGQVMADSATIMAELAGAAFTGGATGASIGARIGWGAGRKATSMTLLARAAAMRSSQAGRAAGTLGTAVLGREYLPQIIGSPGGQSTLNALNRALPDVMNGLTEEQRLAFAEYTDRQFAEEILPMVLEEHPIWKGMAEDALGTSVEMVGGAVLSKLPPFAVVKGLQMRLLQRAAKGGGGPARIAKVLEDKAFVSDFFSEVGEEIMQGAAVEGAFGKGEMGQRLMSGIPTEWEQYAAIFAMSDMPPAAAAAYQSVRALARRVDEQENGIRIDNPTSADMGREVMVGKLQGHIVGVRNDPDGLEGGTRVEVQFPDGSTQMLAPSAIRGIPVQAPGAVGDAGQVETSTGGDAISAGEATAATAGVEPVVSIEPEAVATFAREAGIEAPEVVQPRTETEAAAVQLARNLGREIVLVAGQGAGRVTGMIDEQGRMFVHADSADPLGVAVHEMGHDLATTLGEDTFRAEMAQLEDVAPGMAQRYRDRWIRRNDAGQAQADGAPTAGLATEEGFTSLAEEYAALISYASTTQGAQDMRAVAEYTPTLFQRMVDTVRRFVRRVKPDSPMGALDRIEQATRQRPDRAAAALSVYLADLYKRGFGVDTRAAEGAAPAADVAQGASLLQMLQEEGRRLGVEPVNPSPPSQAPATAATPLPPAPLPGVYIPPATGAPVEAPGTPQAPAAPSAPQETVQSPAQPQAAPGGAGTPPTAAVPSGTAQGVQRAQEAVQGALAGGAPGIFETPPRADLNQPSPSAAQRSLADVVDYVRGNPGQGSRAARKAEGLERLRQDYDGVRSNIEMLLTTGQLLNAWQTHALNQIIAGLELDALRGDKAAAEDAVRLTWLRRDNRSDLSAAMSANVGEGRAAGDSDFELMVEFINKMPSRDAQRYAELRAQYAATASALALSPGFRGDARQTNFRNRNAANGDQFQSGKRFASPLNSEGQLRSAEELADIARKMKAIEARNAERMRKAGEAVANLGLGKTLDQLVPDDFIHPDYGYKIVNAITTAKATWYDKFIEYWYISVLGGPKTQLVNISGNAVMGGKQGTIDKLSEGMVNLILPEVWGTKRKDATTLQEAAWWWQGFMPGLTKGYRNYLRALRTEMPVYEPELRRKGVENLGDYAMKVEDLYGPQIGGKLGKTLRFPSTTQLLAWDEFMKTTIAQSQTWSAAMRKASSEGLTGEARKRRAHELLQNYTDDIYTEGVYAARRATFQDKGGVISEKIIELGRKAHDTLEVVGNKWAFGLPLYLAVLPFKRTPVRIAGAFARLTPLQLFSVGVEAWAGRNDPDAGYRGNRMKLVRDVSDSLQAIGLTALVVALSDMEDEDGLPVVTGSRAADRRESNLEYRSAPPMTVSLFGRRWDYSRIEPISTALAALVDATNAYKDAVATTGARSTSSAQALERLMLSAMEQSRDKTFLRGLDDFLSLFEGTSSMVVQDMEGANEKFAKVFRDTYITTLVPNVFRQPARESDDFMREARTIEDDGWPLFLTDGMAPMASDPIAQVMGEDPKVPKRDLWGRPIERKGTIKQSTTALWQLVNTASRMSPVGVIPEKTRREMLPDILMFRWRERVHNQEVIPERGYLPSAAPRSFQMDNQRYRWTAQEYDRLVEESGQRAYDAVMKLIDSGRVSPEQPTEEHMALISKVISEQRAAVSSRLKRERKREMRSMEVEASAR